MAISDELEKALSDNTLDDSALLRLIELELDKTDTWEDPPYRNDRRKLNRERDRIIRRHQGKDLRFKVTGRKKVYGLTSDELEELRLRKVVEEIKLELN